MMSGELTCILASIQERAEGPMRKFRDVDASQRDVPRLLAAIEAVLKLADEWEDSAVIEYPSGPLREAITVALMPPGTEQEVTDEPSA